MSSTIRVHCTHIENLERNIQNFWHIEEVPSSMPLTSDEQECEDHFRSTVARDEHGRYVVRLPFRTGFTGELGDSRSPALKCLKSMEHRLQKDPDKAAAYTQFLTKYEQLGHMIRVPVSENRSCSRLYYIPHHAVFRFVNNEFKIRVVFNASKQTLDGSSLNDYLLVGPRLQADLAAIILRWRAFPYVITTDITKMYRQIKIDSRDVEYQKILWRKSPSDPVSEFQLLMVTYGTTSAPYLALRVLKQLADDEGDAFPLARDILLKSIYVDDCIFGAYSISEALAMKDQLINLLMKGCLPLSKWAANDKRLLSAPSHNPSTETMVKEFALHDSIHILGIEWKPVSDTFHYTVVVSDLRVPTKRSILSAISKIFDPLGWISPVIIQAKIFIQRLWEIKCDWDEHLPSHLVDEWNMFHSQLPHLAQLTIQRWIGTISASDNLQFHGYCDASSAAYAAMVYLRIQTPLGIHATLLVAKSKVAPLKSLTIPQLELCAALLLAKLAQWTRDSLSLPSTPLFCWSDSTITLARIRQPFAKWKVFVANRVSQIHHLIPDATWGHVVTGENPSDCASRGVTPDEFLRDQQWWTGPFWLTQPPSEWPKRSSDLDHNEDPERIHKVSVAHVGIVEPWDFPSRYSSWFRLIRVTAYVNRFLNRLRRRPVDERLANELTMQELQWSKIFWLKYVQRELFSDEIKDIQNNTLPTSNSLASLSPFIDPDGLVRCRGRLVHSALKPSGKHPIVLKWHPLIRNLIRDIHERLYHCGPALLLATLRQEFWIVRLRQLVRSILYSCVRCTRVRGRTENQLMGDLPQVRVTPSGRAFVYVGLDYAGPILIKLTAGRGNRATKAYIAVFVCMVTKAMHLEVVCSCSVPAFLAALQRFVSRRGVPSTIYSDNGTNFVGADREITRSFRDATRNADVCNYGVERGISWKFIPPSAPHFGGLWEGSVKNVKGYLSRVMGPYLFTLEEMNTTLCRIEACINSRPQSPMSDNIDDFSVLTPGHFLIGAPLISMPESSVLDVNENRLSKWQLVQQLTERFWQRWSHDYLHTLHQRSKWLTCNARLVPGRLVLIKTSGLPPSHWRLGRIIQCHPGQDGLVRVVTVQTSNASYKRPITKLCLLPDDIVAAENGPPQN